MLIPMTAERWEVCADQAWSLACSLKTSGFPTYLDGVKTRADFERKARQGLADERDALLTFERDGAARGFIHAYALPEEHYVSTCLFLTEDGWQSAALAEFTAWARGCWPGARLDLGFPAENAAACAWLEANGFTRLEQSTEYMLSLDDAPEREVPPGVRRLTNAPEDAALLRALHTDPAMYWTSERVLADWQDWLVYVNRRDALLMCMRDAALPEIFAVFCPKAMWESAVPGMLAACTRTLRAEGARHLCYFAEDDAEAAVLAEAGFRQIAGYAAFTTRL